MNYIVSLSNDTSYGILYTLLSVLKEPVSGGGVTSKWALVVDIAWLWMAYRELRG
jgi:hypothetical protein